MVRRGLRGRLIGIVFSLNHERKDTKSLVGRCLSGAGLHFHAKRTICEKKGRSRKGELLVRFELLSVWLARNHHRDTINTEVVLEWIFGDWNE